MEWVWWLGAALLLAVVEILSVDLVLIMFAAGALVATGLALLDTPLWVQIAGFAVTSTLLLVALRPYLLRHLRQRVPLVETNSAAHVGRVAVAVTPVTERGGRVKLAGEVWTARTDDRGGIDTGDEVSVLRIDGATAVVTRLHDAGHRSVDGPTTRPTEENAL